MVIEIEKDQQSGVSLCKCADSRDEPFETFAFQHDPIGLPEIVNVPVKGKVFTEDEEKELLREVFDGESLKYSELAESMKVPFEVGLSKAKSLIREYQKRNWIIKNGSSHSPKTVYKLMI
jgi:hypothetical protein